VRSLGRRTVDFNTDTSAFAAPYHAAHLCSPEGSIGIATNARKHSGDFVSMIERETIQIDGLSINHGSVGNWLIDGNANQPALSAAGSGPHLGGPQGRVSLAADTS
jgi:hypothetical protein